MNTIDVVIPTMWKSKEFPDALIQYIQSPHISNVFVVDNDRRKRPKQIDVLQTPKFHLISYGRNIYVNPAWNEGYYRSKANILAIVNDDIQVEDSVFEDFKTIDFTNIDVVGVHLKNTLDNYHIGVHGGKDELFKLNYDRTEPIGKQGYAFGVFLMIKRSSYKVIPSLYQIWYGDEYLTQNNENIYIFKTSRIKGEISKTLVDLKKSKSIDDRIRLDSTNAYNFQHIRNARKWDLVNCKKENS